MSIDDRSHARLNPLTGEWLLVSPQRLQRPWQGQVERETIDTLPHYDAACYLCPGNIRANGARNPDYTGPFVFDNDFSALSAQGAAQSTNTELIKCRSETGRCQVICYTERHDLRLATMQPAQVRSALEAMFGVFAKLEQQDDIAYVQVFENRGAMMGCSNAHPHAQAWATSSLPTEVDKESRSQLDYFTRHGSSLLVDYLAAEMDHADRIVTATTDFVALVPYWAIWPFEVLILPRRAISGPGDLTAGECSSLADMLQRVLAGYDKLFETSTPYSMGFHARPADGKQHPEWQFHWHIYPPLLRSATVRKHLVGFEMLAMPQRDLTPEAAAERLRSAVAAQE